MISELFTVFYRILAAKDLALLGGVYWRFQFNYIDRNLPTNFNLGRLTFLHGHMGVILSRQFYY